MPRSQGALSRLAELMRRVNSSTDTEVILEEIAHGVVDVLGYGVAAIARLEVTMRRARPPQATRQIRRIEPPGPQPVGVATLTRSTRWKAARPSG